MYKFKACGTFISVYSLYKSERLTINLTFTKGLFVCNNLRMRRLGIRIEICARAKQGSPYSWQLSKEAHHSAKCLSFSTSIKCLISK